VAGPDTWQTPDAYKVVKLNGERITLWNALNAFQGISLASLLLTGFFQDYWEKTIRPPMIKFQNCSSVYLIRTA
jgi:hypothetical protein